MAGCPLWVEADILACVRHVRFGPNSRSEKRGAPVVMARIINFLSSNDKTRIAPDKNFVASNYKMSSVLFCVLRPIVCGVVSVKALAISYIRPNPPIIVIIGVVTSLRHGRRPKNNPRGIFLEWRVVSAWLKS